MDSSTSPKLIALLFTDMVDSSSLKVELGDVDYVTHVARPHNDILRQAFADSHGVENNYTGDGFLATFESVADAVNAALLIHERLRRRQWQRTTPQTRIGIHLGDTTMMAGAAIGQELIASHAADVAARVMGLGEGGQTLLTRAAFDSARQYIRQHPAPAEPGATLELVWLAHGYYQFKGKPEPMEIFEVGAKDLAPLSAPADGDKAKRAATAEEQATLGWRPAPELTIPRRDDWIIAEKIGEGGFGEVWLARHRRTKERRVFKFCFDAERVRHFKRELTLFKLLREVLGERPDIAKLLEVQLDQPPYFLESVHVREGNLREWADRAGGIGTIPLETRLDLLAQVARAAAAAHSIGVIHKDLKPSNIFVETRSDGTPQPMLADFGVGTVADRALLAEYNVTMTGLTQGILDDSSYSGTRLYQPPEMMVGQPPTVQGDVYALGVMLYQLAVGDLSRPLGSGWESDVEDPLAAQDIRDATHRDPTRRLASAAELADRIDSMDERRAKRLALVNAERRARRARALAWLAAAMLLITTLAGGLSALSYRQWQRAEQSAELAKRRRTEAEEARVRADREAARAEANLALAERRRREAESAQLSEQKHRVQAQALQAEAEKQRDRSDVLAKTVVSSLDQLNPLEYGSSVKELLDKVAGELPEAYEDEPLLLGELLMSLGYAYRGNGFYTEAVAVFERVQAIRLKQLGAEDVGTLDAINALGIALCVGGRPRDAIPLHKQAYEGRKKILGPFDAETLDSLHCHAFAHMEAGELETAIPLQVEVIAQMKKHLGVDHSYTMTAINNLAYAYERTDRLADALTLFQEKSKLSAKNLGKGHPDTLLAESNRAWVHYRLKQYDEAIPIYREALQGNLQVYQKAHPDVCGTLNGFLRTLKAADRYADAVDVCDAYLGPPHERVALMPSLPILIRMHLAEVYDVAGRAEEASLFYSSAHEEAQEMLVSADNASPDHLYFSGVAYAMVARGFGRDDNPVTNPDEPKRHALDCLAAAIRRGHGAFGEREHLDLSALSGDEEFEALVAASRESDKPEQAGEDAGLANGPARSKGD